jgi:hypothetical protein
MRHVRVTVPPATGLRFVPIQSALRNKNTTVPRDNPQIVRLACPRLTGADTMIST